MLQWDTLYAFYPKLAANLLGKFQRYKSCFLDCELSMTKFLSYLTRLFYAVVVSFVFMLGGLVGALTAGKEEVIQPNSSLGSYLAGRYASSKYDTEQAASYMRRALDSEPSNRDILEQAFLLELMEGNWEQARDLADRLIVIDPSHPFARLFRGVDKLQSTDLEQAKAHFLASSEGPLAALISNIGQAWILSDQGKYHQAIKLLNKSSDKSWIRDYQQYHRALIADVNGRINDAEKAYARLFRKYHQMVRLVGAYAQFLARNKKTKAAIDVLNSHFKKSSFRHPDLELLLSQIQNKQAFTPYVQTSKEGLSEIFFSLGDRRAETGGVDDGLIFLQLARFLRPSFAAADYSLANLLYQAKKYDRSIVFLNNIQESSPIWLEAQILKAQSLSANGAADTALKLLSSLTEQHGEKIDLFNALGKLYLDEKKYDQASVNYSKAISLLGKVEPNHWFYFYGRGISYERQKIWPKAEKDFKKALQLSPNRAEVLNYLGYSWVDQNLHLQEALKLIRKAVKLKPNSGYYVDSLGWAYYRLGRYNDALGFLEKAVTLQPADPVINDHLGDVYWRVGRYVEAKYQWKQVLSLKPEKDLIEKINQKLQSGLTDKQQAKALLEE